MIGSNARGIAGLERVAQTEVHQDAADYNRCFGKWKDFLLIVSATAEIKRPAPIFCNEHLIRMNLGPGSIFSRLSWLRAG